MDECSYEEIISTLAKCGRPDLIADFKEHVKRDYDYEPTAKEKREAKADDDCSTGEEEEINVKVDEDGFLRLSTESESE